MNAVVEWRNGGGPTAAAATRRATHSVTSPSTRLRSSRLAGDLRRLAVPLSPSTRLRSSPRLPSTRSRSSPGRRSSAPGRPSLAINPVALLCGAPLGGAPLAPAISGAPLREVAPGSLLSARSRSPAIPPTCSHYPPPPSRSCWRGEEAESPPALRNEPHSSSMRESSQVGARPLGSANSRSRIAGPRGCICGN